MTKIYSTLLFIALLLLSNDSISQPSTGIIPTPQTVEIKDGYFSFSEKTSVIISTEYLNENNQFAISQLQETITESYGIEDPLIINSKSKKFSKINILIKETDETKVVGNQGYILDITPGKILIKTSTDVGFFYAIQSLRQLIRYNVNMNQKSIPSMTITDFPKIEYRGWMDDISRGPIPTVDFIKREIATLSEYKLNFFNLYTEQVFKVESHPGVAPTDGLTKEEVNELEEFAKKYHIELIGNQQCFAHAENTLKIPYYVNIKDNASNVNPGSEATYSFYEDVFAEVAPAYSSRLFNINCDETEGLGTGLAKEYVDSVGVSNAYARHINRINSILKKYDKRVMMWGDIAVKHPEIIRQLPQDMIIIAWSYVPADNFDNLILPFTNTGFDFMIAPGVSCWSQVFPNISASVRNIANFVRDGHKNKTMGVMNTCWDDSGEDFFNNNWYGLLWGAEMSWKPIENTDVELADQEISDRLLIFNEGFDNQFFGTNDVKVSSIISAIDSLRSVSSTGILYDVTTWKSLTDFYSPENYNIQNSENINCIYLLNKIKSNITTARESVKRNADVLDYISYSCNRVYSNVLSGMLRINLYNTYIDNSLIQNKMNVSSDMLFNNMADLRAEYAELWDRENRSFSRDRVLNKFDKVGNTLLNINKTVFISTSNGTDGQTVNLRTFTKDKDIYYTIDGTEPTIFSFKYEKPFTINNSTMVKARVIDMEGVGETTEQYILSHKGIGNIVKINHKYSAYNPAYSGGGINAVADGIRGSYSYADGCWQGLQGQDFDVEYDFKKSIQISSISARFINSVYDWIMTPQVVEIYTSKDGKTYSLVGSKSISIDYQQCKQRFIDINMNDLNIESRYLRVVAKYPGALPDYHQAPGAESYIFIDEIVIM